jgi:hypothetical protein
MAPEKVADMTIEELKAVISEVVAQQLKSQNFDVPTRPTVNIRGELELAQSPQWLRKHWRTNQTVMSFGDDWSVYDHFFSHVSLREEQARSLQRLRKHLRTNQTVISFEDDLAEEKLENFEILIQQLLDRDHTGSNQKIKTPLPQRTKAEQLARNLAVIELLHEWREEGNEEEERESFENLKRALDEDRLSDRPLFPHK